MINGDMGSESIKRPSSEQEDRDAPDAGEDENDDELLLWLRLFTSAEFEPIV